MLIMENNKSLYREKYYFRDRKFILPNHKFGIYSFFESEFMPGYLSWTSPRFGFYLLYFVVEGEFEDTDPAGRKSILSPGGFSLNPCEYNYTSRAINRNCKRKCFHLYKTEFTRKLISLFFPEGFVKVQLSDPAAVEGLFDRIKEEFCRPDPGNDPSPLMGLVTELMENIRYQLPAEEHAAKLNEVLAYIETSLVNPDLKRETICEKCSISTSSLDRLFRKFVKMSVNEYINAKRLEQVKTFLATPGLRINEIAGASGFASAIHMNWLFRKKFDMTPSQYRKKLLLASKPFLNIE